ncbi:sigma-70 family RNA polymerase sigma factor [uncultured Jatrophihabitans sp.]|uniref:sigma-70 family RNA polymerase sigma factor n=1 Tax=uncultured Jatrophihabitans sp. TaxID=1610747 RepID=UPI0035CAC891
MPRAAFPEPDANEPRDVFSTTALRTLVALLNDALAALATQPRVAGVAAMSSFETQAVSLTTPLAGRSSRGFEPTVVPDRSADDDPDPLDPGIDAEHVETWHLVHLAQEGDGEAFGMLYDRYVDSVFRFIYYRVNDRALAEDFTSETFVRALRRIGTISYQGRDIGAWFVTIARNIVLDHVKSARHRLETPTGETIEGPEHTHSTETAVLAALASEQLMAAVDQLGDEQRECVLLRFMQGLSVTETAAVMGKNDGAIKALQHRAVRKLADLVGDDLR